MACPYCRSRQCQIIADFSKSVWGNWGWRLGVKKKFSANSAIIWKITPTRSKHMGLRTRKRSRKRSVA